MSVQEQLHKLDIVLPSPTRPVAAFVPFVRTGGLVFMSGHIAKKDGKPWVGRLGLDVTADEGRLAARPVAIDLLGTMVAAVDGAYAVGGSRRDPAAARHAKAAAAVLLASRVVS